MNPFFIRLNSFLLLFICAIPVFAQVTSPADTFPVPKKDVYNLFYLQRQPNSNTIMIDLNMTNGELDLDNPVHVYWRRYAEQGQSEELSWIQRTFAYGIDSKKISDTAYELNFVSYKKRKFWLEKDAEGQWQVFTTFSNGKKMILKRIYMHINGGSFWSPNIEYVELKAMMPDTNQEVRERIKIK
jgi:hypothetical protein